MTGWVVVVVNVEGGHSKWNLNLSNWGGSHITQTELNDKKEGCVCFWPAPVNLEFS